MSAVWMTSPRWKVSHLIRTDTEHDWRGSSYANTACGARINYGRLEPEPDTIERCAGCRRAAHLHDAAAGS